MRFIAALALTAITIFTFAPLSTKAQGSGAAGLLFAAANRERTARGLAPLKWSDALATAAQEHALKLAAQNTLSHQLPGEPPPYDRAALAGARFNAMAENVAESPSAESIQQQWMHSAPHRANLLDPHLDSLGVAVAERNGILFAVEDFSLAVETLSVAEQEKIVDAKLRSRGLRLLDYTADARRSCAMDNGYAGIHEPSFVLHYATADLQSLPDMLVQRIETGRYHAAAVGACSSNAKLGFSSYRLAVLLYE
jgi:hypothetical protein